MAITSLNWPKKSNKGQENSKAKKTGMAQRVHQWTNMSLKKKTNKPEVDIKINTESFTLIGVTDQEQQSWGWPEDVFCS